MFFAVQISDISFEQLLLTSALLLFLQRNNIVGKLQHQTHPPTHLSCPGGAALRESGTESLPCMAAPILRSQQLTFW